MATASQETWVADSDGLKFWGTVRQLTECAKCGSRLHGGDHTPHKVCDTFKPTMHFLCDDCYETLPE